MSSVIRGDDNFDSAVVRYVPVTPVATTSGTFADITGIPAGINSVIVTIYGVVTSGTSNYHIQLGAGAIQTTGYQSQASVGSVSTGVKTTGLVIATNVLSAAAVVTGTVHLYRQSGNIWIMSALLGTVSPSAALGSIAMGHVSLSGALDRIRFTTENGTDTFTAGSFTISY